MGDDSEWQNPAYTPEQIADIKAHAVLAPAQTMVIHGHQTPEQGLASGRLSQEDYQRLTGSPTADRGLMAGLFPRTSGALEAGASYPRQALGTGLDLASLLGRIGASAASSMAGREGFLESMRRTMPSQDESAGKGFLDSFARDPSNALIPLGFGLASKLPAVAKGLNAMGRVGQSVAEGTGYAGSQLADQYASTGSPGTAEENALRFGLASALPLASRAGGSALQALKAVPANRMPGTPEGEAFRKWFGASKVVDENGDPLTVYHGTNKDFDAFDPSLSGSKSGTGAPEGSFFFSSKPDVASSYTVARQGDFSQDIFPGGNVIPANLAIKKPLKVNAKGESWRNIQYRGNFYDINELVQKAKESGKYDGVIVKNVADKGIGDVENKTANTIVPFYPEQIKSVFNRGTWSSTDPNIMHLSGGMVPSRYSALNSLRNRASNATANAALHGFVPTYQEMNGQN